MLGETVKIIVVFTVPSDYYSHENLIRSSNFLFSISHPIDLEARLRIRSRNWVSDRRLSYSGL